MRTFQMVTACVIVSIVPITWIGFFLGLNPNWAYYATIICYLINQVAAVLVLRTLYTFSIMKYITSAILPCISYGMLVPLIPIFIRIYTTPCFMQLSLLSISTLISAVVLGYLLILTTEERAKLKIIIKSKVKWQ